MAEKIKKFLIKLKNDARQLFYYPKTSYGSAYTVDYAKYWEARRGNELAVLSEWQKERADEALKIIEKGSVVLDIGCGDGGILKYFGEKANVRGIGADIDAEALKKAEAAGIQGVCIDVTSVQHLSNLPEADYITAFEILEHMPLPEACIDALLKKARKGIIFSVPNTGYYAHRLRLLLGRFPLQWVVHPGEHLRFWTARDMRYWINSLGLKIEKMVLYQGLPFLNKIFPKLFAQGMIVYIKKSTD